MAELVENAVDDLRRFALEEGMCQIDIFGDDDARRHVLAHQHLVGAGAQDGTQDRIDAVEPPAFGEVTIDERVDAALLAHHAFDNVAEELRLSIAILVAFNFLPEPVSLELGDYMIEVDGGHVHLVERLDGGEPRRGPCLGTSSRSRLLLA
jgi:hypothetical protein